MASPYTNDFFDDAGTAVFPIAEHDQGDPDLAAAANAIFFSSTNDPVNDENSDYPWPAKDEEGSAVALPLHLLDHPESGMIANALVSLGSMPDSDDVENPPYANPANTNSPDAVYALNFLIDLLD